MSRFDNLIQGLFGVKEPFSVEGMIKGFAEALIRLDSEGDRSSDDGVIAEESRRGRPGCRRARGGDIGVVRLRQLEDRMTLGPAEHGGARASAELWLLD